MAFITTTKTYYTNIAFKYVYIIYKCIIKWAQNITICACTVCKIFTTLLFTAPNSIQSILSLKKLSTYNMYIFIGMCILSINIKSCRYKLSLFLVLNNYFKYLLHNTNWSRQLCM